MNKLTAEIARMDIGHLREHQANPHVGLSLREEKYLQALEIALPVLEQQVVVPDRWRLVPVEPTEEMISAGDLYMDGLSRLGDAYEAMLAAAPQPSTTPQIDNDGWLHWNGEMALPPVDSDVRVEIKRRNGEATERQAKCFAWRNSPVKSEFDIIAYRVIENDGREG